MNNAPNSHIGRISQGARNHYLRDHPEHERFLTPFLSTFNVTWGEQIIHQNASYSVFLFEPLPLIKNLFGLHREICVLYSSYPHLQGRVINVLKDFAAKQSQQRQIDTTICFIITRADNRVEWINNLLSDPSSSISFSIIISFHPDQLHYDIIHSRLSTQLHQRDLFDDQLPIRDDAMFIGRNSVIMDLKNAHMQPANRGVFGLRKTGKTSVFFKLERIIKAANDGIFLYFDCKQPMLYRRRWDDLLSYITEKIVEYNPRVSDSDLSVDFESAIQRLDRRLVLVFDEIEYITPWDCVPSLGSHWGDDFLPFWQTIISAQSRNNKFSIWLGGVNPRCIEESKIGDSNNPLFESVPIRYLPPMAEEEIAEILTRLGHPMGLMFDYDASVLKYIHRHYGGHPRVTRIACSEIHSSVYRQNERRPFDITMNFLNKTERFRDVALYNYGKYIVDDLLKFYPDEYELLSELAQDKIDMWPLAAELDFSRHLRNYGLLYDNRIGRPEFSIPGLTPILAKFDSKGKVISPSDRIIPPDERSKWLESRINKILDDFKVLEDLIRESTPSGGIPLLPYGPLGFSRDKIKEIKIVHDWNSFELFILVCHQTFYEEIRAYGEGIGQGANEYMEKIYGEYPAFGKAVQRINTYRNSNFHHPEMQRRKIKEGTRKFLEEDFPGQVFRDVPERQFRLQERVLNGLLNEIGVEISRLS